MVITAACALPFSSSALDASGSLSDSVTYTFNSETGALTISGTGATDDFNYSGDGTSPFLWSNEIKSVVIEDGVTRLGNNLLRGCSNLTSVTFGSSVKEIGKYAIAYCTAITELTLPDGLTTINDHAFNNDRKLETVYLGKSLEVAEDYAFYDCDKLTEISFPKTITSAPTFAVFTCKGLQSINVEDGCEACSSKDGVLYNTDGTTLLKYPCGRTDKTFTVPDEVTVLGPSSIAYNGSLEEIIVGDNVTTLGAYSFRGNANLKSVSWGKNVAEIGRGMFYESKKFESVNVAEGNANFYTLGGVLYATDNSLVLFPPMNQTESLVIPKNVTTILPNAFASCEYLKAVAFEDGTAIESLDDTAFYGAKSIETITLPATVNSIGTRTFEQCVALKTLVIPNPDCALPDDSQAMHKGVSTAPLTVYSYTHCDGTPSTAESYVTKFLGDYTGYFEIRYESLATIPHKLNTGEITATTAATYTKTHRCRVCNNYVKKTYKKTANTFTAKGKTKTVSYKKVKKKNVAVARKDVIVVTKPKGTVSYAKSSGNKKIVVDKKTGKLTVKKGIKKGTYKVKIKVKSDGTNTVKAKTKTVTVTIKVK